MQLPTQEATFLSVNKGSEGSSLCMIYVEMHFKKIPAADGHSGCSVTKTPHQDGDTHFVLQLVHTSLSCFTPCHLSYYVSCLFVMCFYRYL